jgi:hypothetical protein
MAGLSLVFNTRWAISGLNPANVGVKASTLFVTIVAAILVAAALIFVPKALIEQHQRTEKAGAELQMAITRADAYLGAMRRMKSSASVSPAPKISRRVPPGYVRLTQPISITAGSTNVVLQPGNIVELVAREGTQFGFDTSTSITISRSRPPISNEALCNALCLLITQR